MKIYVPGGCGYIGSHTCVELLNAGHQVVIADDLSNSSEDVVRRIQIITGKHPEFYKINACRKEQVQRIFQDHKIDSVILFAGFKAVGESCIKPAMYYRNNLDAALTTLEIMEEYGVSRMVFSSSATVYGPDNPVPYREDSAKCLFCTNPYGWTKAMIEQILRDYAEANRHFSAVLLRYFNPIGAHRSGLLGDDPKGTPNNLMPYITRVAAGLLPRLTVFGGDYDTPDGTGIRDYLHVVDLARGHLKALDYGASHTGSEAINLGTGCGVSVLELIRAFEHSTGIEVPYVMGPRRDGDLARCWADAGKARKLLGWKAEYTVEDMCRDSWNFMKENSSPEGGGVFHG